MSEHLPFDGWGDEFNTFTSGLKDDFDGVIQKAYFGYDAKYNNGKTLCLTLEIVDVATKEEVRQIYSCGDGWDNAEGGKRAVREDGKQTGFNRNTAVVDFFTAIADSENVDAAREVLVKAGFTPYYCTPLEGTTWHWAQKEKEYNVKDKNTKEQKKGTSTRLMPVSFVGGAAPAAAKGGSKRKGKNTWDGLSADDIAMFKEVADEVDTHDEFKIKVAEEFEDWPQAAILDPAFFDHLKSL